MSSNEPPPPNPVLTAYEGFVRDTPLVTRYSMTTLFVSWSLSWFVNSSFAVANVPYFTIFKFEIYRIVLSPLLCQSLLTLVFAYISFVDHGKRLEFSMGSTAFSWLMLTLGGVTNLLFLGICLVLRYTTKNKDWLWAQAYGIWIILFGLIAIECVSAPANSQRRLFFFTVPTLYYPLALLALFSLFGGAQMSYYISTGVGYAYGKGYLDRLKLSQSTFKQWEDTVLLNFTRRQGWVVGHAATGSDAWNNMQVGGGGLSFFQRAAQGAGADDSAEPGTVARPPAGGWGAPGNAEPPSEPTTPAFPSSGGRSLGGASRRPPSSEARAARLEAAARRAASDENV